MAGSKPATSVNEIISLLIQVALTPSSPIDSPWLALKLAPAIPVNRSKHPVESEGSICMSGGGFYPPRFMRRGYPGVPNSAALLKETS